MKLGLGSRPVASVFHVEGEPVSCLCLTLVLLTPEATVAKAGAAAVVVDDEEEPGTSLMDVEQPRKRKGETDQRSDSDVQ